VHRLTTLSLVHGTTTDEKQRAANAAANRRLRKRQRAPKASPSRDGQGSPHPNLQARIDDIGPTSASEVARKDAEIVELRNAKRLLEIKITGLESEIEELRSENAELRQRLAAPRLVA
jgi:hypothetical protein